jgi:hypothetical protein
VSVRLIGAGGGGARTGVARDCSSGDGWVVIAGGDDRRPRDETGKQAHAEPAQALPATAARGRGEHPCASQRLERSDGIELYRAGQALRLGQQATGATVSGPRCGRLGQAEQFVILAAPGAARVADLVGDQLRVDLQAGWGDLDDVSADADAIALAEDGGLVDAAMVDRGAEWRGAVIDE